MVKMSYTIAKIGGTPHRTIRVGAKAQSLIELASKHLFGTGKNYGRWEFTDNGDSERFFRFERDYMEAIDG